MEEIQTYLSLFQGARKKREEKTKFKILSETRKYKMQKKTKNVGL